MEDQEGGEADGDSKPVPFKHYEANKVFMRSLVVAMVLQQLAYALYISSWSTLTSYMSYFAFAKYDIPDGDDFSKWN